MKQETCATDLYFHTITRLLQYSINTLINKLRYTIHEQLRKVHDIGHEDNYGKLAFYANFHPLKIYKLIQS